MAVPSSRSNSRRAKSRSTTKTGTGAAAVPVVRLDNLLPVVLTNTGQASRSRQLASSGIAPHPPGSKPHSAAASICPIRDRPAGSAAAARGYGRRPLSHALPSPLLQINPLPHVEGHKNAPAPAPCPSRPTHPGRPAARSRCAAARFPGRGAAAAAARPLRDTRLVVDDMLLIEARTLASIPARTSAVTA